MIRYFAAVRNGIVVAVRESNRFSYTHAVLLIEQPTAIGETAPRIRAVSWHAGEENARRGLARAARNDAVLELVKAYETPKRSTLGLDVNTVPGLFQISGADNRHED